MRKSNMIFNKIMNTVRTLVFVDKNALNNVKSVKTNNDNNSVLAYRCKKDASDANIVIT